MSPDFDKYRALAKATGDDTHYSDDDLMRLWAAMEHLFAKSTRSHCPQLFIADAAPNHSQTAATAVDSNNTQAIEERSE